jgi:hypothetical protein
MTRDEAAGLLGIAVDADAEMVRQAWRLWAKMAHPDVGGEPEHFARLDRARQVMLQSGCRHTATHFEPSSPPRVPLREVLRRPTQPAALVVGGLITLATGALPHLFTSTLGIPLVLAATVCGLVAAAWAVLAALLVLAPDADRGHRIAVIMLLWLPLVASQILVSMLWSPSLIPVLPVLALPIVTIVAASGFGFRLGETRLG